MKKEQVSITRNEIISSLVKSPHGAVEQYQDMVQKAARQEPEFLAHLIAWNLQKCEVRDALVAIPAYSLSVPEFPQDLRENSLACLATLSPRDFLRAMELAFKVRCLGNGMALERLVKWYVRGIESNWARWERAYLVDRKSVRSLYSKFRLHPGPVQRDIIFEDKYPEKSILSKLKMLPLMSPEEAAGTIMHHRIPFLTVKGCLGKNIKHESVLLALIKTMTPQELAANTKFLEKRGLTTNPVLKVAYQEALEKATAPKARKKAGSLKFNKAMEHVQDDVLKARMEKAQESILNQKMVEGCWAILADRSGSMREAIEKAREISDILARTAEKVYLIFFNTSPTFFDVTGKTLAEIQKISKNMTGNGGTSYSCGIDYLINNNLDVDGIAMIGDGEDGASNVPGRLKAFEKKFDHEPTIYFYETAGGTNSLSRTLSTSGVEFEHIDMRTKKYDYNSLAGLVQTMRVNRYSLADEILDCPLKTLENVIGVKVLERKYAKKEKRGIDAA